MPRTLAKQSPVSTEYADADLGDERLNRRLVLLADRLAARPSDSFPRALNDAEFFKALKTGCQFEKRQLESARSLVNALAILALVAWRLLLLRPLARSSVNAPATSALTAKQLVGRGMHDLLLIELGWRAREGRVGEYGCDQS